MNIDEMLGIDSRDPDQWLALELMRHEREMLTRLVTIRKAKFKQAEVGKLMGVSQSAIAKIETGERDPRLSTLRRYAAALGVLIRYELEEEQEWNSRVQAEFEGSGDHDTSLHIRGEYTKVQQCRPLLRLGGVDEQRV